MDESWCRLVHFYTDTAIPDTMVANGGIFGWPDIRQNPDTFQALATYEDAKMLYHTPLIMQVCLAIIHASVGKPELYLLMVEKAVHAGFSFRNIRTYQGASIFMKG